MSGGTDSTAAALLLKRAGHEVIGITLKLWEYANDCDSSKCCTPEDVRDAKSVAADLNIPFYVRDFSELFEKEVIGHFTDAYLNGRTPNPCAVCNDRIKFKLLDLLAGDINADQIGTGHYARVEAINEAGKTYFQLKRGVDTTRDQSYFLFRLNQQRLSRLLFPLGGLLKKEVREILREAGIGRPDKPESRELCFVESSRYSEFVEARHPELLRPGVIVDPSGAVLGEHAGVQRFTVGQRKGIGIASPTPNQPYFVTQIDAKTQKVVLGSRQAALKEQCLVEEVTFTGPPDYQLPSEAQVQLRYRGSPIDCRLEMLSNAADNTKVLVHFKHGKEIPAPGQAAVFYDGDRLLGGGWISAEY